MYMLIADTFILQNCVVTSPSIGTIRVSCDSSHQIIVTLTCTNTCNNPMVTSNGSSPLNVTGLDPGIIYTVTIKVFDGTQMIMNDQTEMRNITVLGDQSGEIYMYAHRMYICVCECCTFIHSFIHLNYIHSCYMHVHTSLQSYVSSRVITVEFCWYVCTYTYVRTYVLIPIPKIRSMYIQKTQLKDPT